MQTLLAKTRKPLSLLAMLLVMAPTLVMACPTCKDGLAEANAASQAMANGYFYSILFMMSMPFVIIGTFGGVAYLSIRRAREQQLHEPTKSQADSTF